MVALFNTTGSQVVKRLAEERRFAGGVTSGLALTLIVITDDGGVPEAEAAATIAAQQHPTRVLIVVRRHVLSQESQLDAEIVVGGRLGPCEAVVMRMQGRLALHAESVALPLLAPDVPVLTWWRSPPPERIAYDPLGVVADRRVTDASAAPDPIAALAQRAADYVPGDTDLAWTRITPWRTLVASVFDTASAPAVSAEISAPASDPGAVLLAGWLKTRLGIEPVITNGPKRLNRIELVLSDGVLMSIVKGEGEATLRRTSYPDRTMPLLDRALGEELAEELSRLDPDQPYAHALGAAMGRNGELPGVTTDLTAGTLGGSDRVGRREHIWHDPALAERPEQSGRGSS
ncbi:MAG: glucose-6-phosphate dehydrogenase assembly protein OpcA [Micromonosporaceae bacterium]